VARQKLGQHFLASGRILDRIARAATGGTHSLVIEIGPGKGALTRHLLPLFERVVAVELDPALAAHLREEFRHEPRLEVVEGDALDITWPAWGAGVVAGNLPYYVSTAIISRYLQNPGAVSPGVFLIQKEVAERIAAQPGTRDYGYLSVECQLLARAEYLFTVPPGAFHPPPKVESAVVRLTPAVQFPQFETTAFLRFVSSCFRQKRKTLRNNLVGLYGRERLDRYPEANRRAEQLSLAELAHLYGELTAQAPVTAEHTNRQ